MKEHITYFLFAFTSLFTIINPFGAMPLYMSVTQNMQRHRAVRVARRAVITSFIALLAFAVTGKFLFAFFNISINGLRVVGGVLLFIVGYDMLQAKIARTKSISAEETDEIDEMAISPLAIPLLGGPGAITVTIVLTQDAEHISQKILLLLSLIAVSVATFLFLIGSKKITEFLGKSGSKVFNRLMGLIIMMIAVEFFFSGLSHYVRNILAG